jgi:hypothetical protein
MKQSVAVFRAMTDAINAGKLFPVFSFEGCMF